MEPACESLVSTTNGNRTVVGDTPIRDIRFRRSASIHQPMSTNQNSDTIPLLLYSSALAGSAFPFVDRSTVTRSLCMSARCASCMRVMYAIYIRVRGP